MNHSFCLVLITVVMLIDYALSLISIARENGAEIIFLSACCCVLNEKRAQ